MAVGWVPGAGDAVLEGGLVDEEGVGERGSGVEMCVCPGEVSFVRFWLECIFVLGKGERR